MVLPLRPRGPRGTGSDRDGADATCLWKRHRCCTGRKGADHGGAAAPWRGPLGRLGRTPIWGQSTSPRGALSSKNASPHDIAHPPPAVYWAVSPQHGGGGDRGHTADSTGTAGHYPGTP